MITFIVCIFLLFILSSGAPVSGDFAFSLEDSIAAVRSSARSPRATLHERLQAIDAVRERFTGRMDAYYADIFQLLGGGLGDRSQSFVSEWHRVHRVSLAPKRNGVAAVSAIINDRLRLIMCTVPKIDSTTWRKTMLYLEHPELYANPKGGNRTIPPPDQHNIKKNGVKIMAQQSPATAIDYYNDPRYLKLFHCRNPVVRVLSAWISKNAQSSNPISFAADHATFKEFIMHLKSGAVNLSAADAHIRHQHSYCDSDRGAHYDLFLKMENRRAWNGALLRLLKLENDAFLAPLFLKQVRPKADRLDVLLAHYTSELLQAVKSLYHKDILYFGYIDDINLLTEIIQLRDEILL